MSAQQQATLTPSQVCHIGAQSVQFWIDNIQFWVDNELPGDDLLNEFPDSDLEVVVYVLSQLSQMLDDRSEGYAKREI